MKTIKYQELRLAEQTIIEILDETTIPLNELTYVIVKKLQKHEKELNAALEFYTTFCPPLHPAFLDGNCKYQGRLHAVFGAFAVLELEEYGYRDAAKIYSFENRN